MTLLSRAASLLRSHPLLALALAGGIAALAVTRSCNRGGEAGKELKRRDEAAELQAGLAANGSGALVATRSEKALALAYVAALARVNGLEAELAKVRAAAPGAKPVAVVEAATGPVTAGGAPRNATPGGEATGHSAPPGSGSCDAGPTGETGTAASATPSVQPPHEIASGGTCLLAQGDVGDLRVAQVALETRGGNRILAGTMEAWRLLPGPETRILSGPLRVSTFVESPQPGSETPGYGIGAIGIAGRAGWMAGPLVSPPPLRIPWVGWRVEALAGGALGPSGEWAVLAGGVVRP